MNKKELSSPDWDLIRMKEAVEASSITIPQGLNASDITQFILDNGFSGGQRIPPTR